MNSIQWKRLDNGIHLGLDLGIAEIANRTLVRIMRKRLLHRCLVTESAYKVTKYFADVQVLIDKAEHPQRNGVLIYVFGVIFHNKTFVCWQR